MSNSNIKQKFIRYMQKEAKNKAQEENSVIKEEKGEIDYEYEKDREKLVEEELETIEKVKQILPSFTSFQALQLCKRFYFDRKLCVTQANLNQDKIIKDSNGDWTTVEQTGKVSGETLSKERYKSLKAK